MSVDTFGATNSEFQLKMRDPVSTTVGEDGVSTHTYVLSDGKPAKFQLITNLAKLPGPHGKFLSNPMEEGERLDSDVYYINTKKDFTGESNRPVAILTVSRAGQSDSDLICGLFERKYDDGTVFLHGKDSKTGIQYRIYANEARQVGGLTETTAVANG